MDQRPTSPPRTYGWRWGPDEQRRPGLPWIGIFLVVFGLALLVERALPDYRRLGDVALLAAVVASLVASALVLAAFVARSARHPAPVIELGLLRVRSFAAVFPSGLQASSRVSGSWSSAWPCRTSTGALSALR